MANSEKRYHKTEPIKTIKKNGRSKRHNLKSAHKNGDSHNDAHVICNTNEEKCIDKLCKTNDDLASQSLNSIEQCSSSTNKNDKNCDVTKNEITQGLIEFEDVNEGSIRETSEETIVETSSIKSLNMTDEKESKHDLKLMCSLCKANKTNCFICGLDIDDPGQKIVCKLCK